MAIFRYRRTKEMAPREGVKYATTYYQQSSDEYVRTRAHIRQVAGEILEYIEANPSWLEFVQQPLQGFPRTEGQANYTIEDILTDMLNQTNTDKDIPSGMLGRWNRLFDGTEYDIEMLQELTPTGVSPRLFENLFTGVTND
jgi:hypothetical protein